MGLRRGCSVPLCCLFRLGVVSPSASGWAHPCQLYSWPAETTCAQRRGWDGGSEGLGPAGKGEEGYYSHPSSLNLLLYKRGSCRAQHHLKALAGSFILLGHHPPIYPSSKRSTRAPSQISRDFLVPRPRLRLQFFPWSYLWTHAHGKLCWFSQGSSGQRWKTMALWSPLCLRLDDSAGETATATGALLIIALRVATHGAEQTQAPLRSAHPTTNSLIEIRVTFIGIRVMFIEIRVEFCLGCSRAFSSPCQATTWPVLSQMHQPFLLPGSP